MIPAAAALHGSSMAFGAISQAIAALYGVASNLNDFIDRHIAEMKSSSNPTIERTGRILEGAKYGFGLGYMSSVTIIAVGQYLLGNTLAAASTVATAATLTNPIAMTCAAMGAILYGWGALRDEERNDILDTLARGLEIGVELIRSVIGFVIRTAQELISSKALKEFKAYIGDKAALFGRSLGDVTRQTLDRLSDAASTVRQHAGEALDSTAQAASAAREHIGETLSEVGKAASVAASHAIDHTSSAAQQALESGKAAIRRVRKDGGDADKVK